MSVGLDSVSAHTMAGFRYTRAATFSIECCTVFVDGDGGGGAGNADAGAHDDDDDGDHHRHHGSSWCLWWWWWWWWPPLPVAAAVPEDTVVSLCLVVATVCRVCQASPCAMQACERIHAVYAMVRGAVVSGSRLVHGT